MKTVVMPNLNRDKLSYLTFVVWSLIIIHAAFAFVETYVIFEDLSGIFEGQLSGFASILVLLVAFAIPSIPLQFSIGLLFRKNWARIGILVVSAIGIAGPIIDLALFSVIAAPDTLGQSIDFLNWFWVSRVLTRIPIVVFSFLVFRYFTRSEIKKEFSQRRS